eukprot:114705_1
MFFNCSGSNHTEWEKTYRCITYQNIHQQVLIQHSIESSCHLWFQHEYYAHHGHHYTRINSDNKLCMGFGVACNICEYSYPQGSIICFDNMENPSFNESTRMAKGLRDPVGFTWDRNDILWFTDHNRDKMGDDKPDCELNKLSYIDEHFGFPYCQSIGSGDPYKRDYIG